jgi:hypothetical protein
VLLTGLGRWVDATEHLIPGVPEGIPNCVAPLVLSCCKHKAPFPFVSVPCPCPAAAICRRLYSRQDIGVGRFRKLFGGRQRRGQNKERHAKAAGALGYLSITCQRSAAGPVPMWCGLV